MTSKIIKLSFIALVLTACTIEEVSIENISSKNINTTQLTNEIISNTNIEEINNYSDQNRAAPVVAVNQGGPTNSTYIQITYEPGLNGPQRAAIRAQYQDYVGLYAYSICAYVYDREIWQVDTDILNCDSCISDKPNVLKNDPNIDKVALQNNCND